MFYFYMRHTFENMPVHYLCMYKSNKTFGYFRHYHMDTVDVQLNKQCHMWAINKFTKYLT